MSDIDRIIRKGIDAADIRAAFASGWTWRRSARTSRPIRISWRRNDAAGMVLAIEPGIYWMAAEACA